VQKMGGSIARQLAQAVQWKYSIPCTSCSVYEWGLARVRVMAICSSHFHEFKSSLVREFKLFWEFCKIHDFGVA